jgi:hypothetical protein
MMKCGGQSEEKLANEEIQAILTQVNKLKIKIIFKILKIHYT